MKWSFPLARVAGIPIRMHLSFLLLLGWIAWLGWREAGWHSSLWAVALILAVFACVTLHELGHSLVAMRFGAEVRGVTLYPIGGVASLKSIPEKPWQEFAVALAGPAVNVAIAALLVAVRRGMPGWSEVDAFPASPGQLLDSLIRVNIVLAVFNLVPAFPMDGGRVMRSLLAMFLPYARATSLAAAVGQALAAGFVLVGLAVNPFLMVIGFFVFFGAETEERSVRVKGMLKDVLACDVMVTEFVRLSPEDTVARCLEHVYHRRQEDFVVEFEGRMVGVLARKDWMAALHRDGSSARVADIMRRGFISVDARTPLARVYQDLFTLEQGVFPVVREGQLVGLLTGEGLSRYLLLEEARQKSESRPPPVVEQGDPVRFTVDLG